MKKISHWLNLFLTRSIGKSLNSKCLYSDNCVGWFKLNNVLAFLLIVLSAEIASTQGCSSIVFSVQNTNQCCYNLTAKNMTDNCFQQLNLSFLDGVFTSYTPASGWQVVQVSPKEYNVRPSMGFIPFGNVNIGSFCVTGTLSQSLTILYDDLCALEACEIMLPVKVCMPENTIHGVNYVDLGCEGKPYTNQPLLVDWPIELFDEFGQIIANTQTDDKGIFSFSNLMPGKYFCKEGIRTGWKSSIPASGQHSITLSGTKDTSVVNFGNCQTNCSCDSVYVLVTRLENVNQDTGYYSVNVFNSKNYCFNKLEIEIDSEFYAGHVQDPPQLDYWNIYVFHRGRSTIIEFSPNGGFIPDGESLLGTLKVVNVGKHLIKTTIYWSDQTSSKDCEYRYAFPFPYTPSLCSCPGNPNPSVNLISNGDFTYGNSNFTSGLGLSLSCSPSRYNVLPNLSAFCNGWPSVPPPSPLMLTVDGRISGSVLIYSAPVLVTPNTDYCFSFKSMRAFTNNNAIPINWELHSPNLIHVFYSGHLAGGTVSGVWNQNQGYVTTGNNVSGLAFIRIYQTSGTPYAQFGIDDICFTKVNTCSVTVNAVQQNSCGSFDWIAHASGPGPYSYQWSCPGIQIDSILSTVQPCGTSTCTVTVTCADGNTATAQSTITTADNTIPSISCPGNQVIQGEYSHGSCISKVTGLKAVYSDNCPDLNVHYKIGNGAFAPGDDASGYIFSGNTSVTYEVTDWCGNKNSCSFTIKVTCDTCACIKDGMPELITNGNFNSPTINPGSDYTSDCSVNREAEYCITASPGAVNRDFINCGDHTTGSGNMMVVNGGLNPNLNVWYQNGIPVSSSGEYQFCFWYTSLNSTSPAKLQVFIDGNPVGNILQAPSTPCTWKKYCYCWKSNGKSSVDIAIKDLNLLASGNDFALDDISFRECNKDTCCFTDVNSFCNHLMSNLTTTVDHANCKVKYNFGNFDNCVYIDKIDWGEGPIENGPWGPNTMSMHTYSGSGTYYLSYLAIALDQNGQICLNKLIHDTISLFCKVPLDSCECKSFTNLEFQNSEWANPHYNVTCENSYSLPCLQPTTPQVFIFQGDLMCNKANCKGRSVNWSIMQGTTFVSSGNAPTIPDANDPTSVHFDVNLNMAWFSPNQIYTMIITGFCGSNVCKCTLEFMFDECPPSSCPSNLVPNPSFELHTICPFTYSMINVTSQWTRANYSTPDYFHSCCPTGVVHVPNNAYGMESAHNGDAYAGIYTYINPSSTINGNYRGYIQVQLSPPMVAFQNYKLQFYVSLADRSLYATNSIGAYFSNSAVFLTATTNMPYTPQVVENNIISNKNGWTLITGNYMASGGENFITIGNYKNDLNTQSLLLTDGDLAHSYYYIDDICLEEVGCDCDKFENLQFFNSSWPYLAKSVTCNDNVILPCSANNGNSLFFFHGDLCCTDTICNNDTLEYSIATDGTKLSSGQVITNVKPNGCVHFDIILNPALYIPGVQYTLVINGKCGTKNCNCRILFSFEPCPCPCDSLSSNVNKGFTDQGSIDYCKRTFTPISLCAQDSVVWTYFDSQNQYINSAISHGNNSVMYDFVIPGNYKICMRVFRSNCPSIQICRNIYIYCTNFPTGCGPGIIQNGDFNEDFRIGHLGEGGYVKNWRKCPNWVKSLVEVVKDPDDSSNASIILFGNQAKPAAIFQPINLMKLDSVVIGYDLIPYQSNTLNANTWLKVILQSDTTSNPRISQTLSTKSLDVLHTLTIRDSVKYEYNPELRYLFFHLENEDSSVISIIGIDNLEFCPIKPVVNTNAMYRNSINIYPNPTKDNLTIESEQAFSKNTILKVLNINGKTVFCENVESGKSRHKLKTSILASGLYFIELAVDGKSVVYEKFVKQ